MKPPGAPKVSPVTQVLVARVAAILDIFFLVINLLTVRESSDLSDLRDGENIPVISWLYHGYIMVISWLMNVNDVL